MTTTASARISTDDAPRAWVEAFTAGWAAAASADAFADHFEPWLAPDVRLVQPGMPTLAGLEAFRERFARPLFALIPDLRGEVERYAVGAGCAYVEMTLRGTLGGRAISWRVCDRVTIRDGRVVERETYCDPRPLLRAVATRPRAWPALLRERRRERRVAAGKA
jgi:ketosteroid isomerase-like protein